MPRMMVSQVRPNRTPATRLVLGFFALVAVVLLLAAASLRGWFPGRGLARWRDSAH